MRIGASQALFQTEGERERRESCLEGAGDGRCGGGASEGPLVALDRGVDARERSSSKGLAADLDGSDDVGHGAHLLGVGELDELVRGTSGDGGDNALGGLIGLAIDCSDLDGTVGVVGDNTTVDILRGTHSAAAATRHVG